VSRTWATEAACSWQDMNEPGLEQYNTDEPCRAGRVIRRGSSGALMIQEFIGCDFQRTMPPAVGGGDRSAPHPQGCSGAKEGF